MEPLNQPPQTSIELVDFNRQYDILFAAFEELKKISLEPRYDKLLRTESDFRQFNLSETGPGISDVLDVEMRPIDFTHPDTTTLAMLNHNVFAASFRRHLMAKEFSFSNRFLSKWRSLAKDVELLYNNVFEYYYRQEETRALKNADERRSYIHSRIARMLWFKNEVEKLYDKEGNYIVGEAVAYRNSVQAQIDDLDAQLASDNKHLDVFQKMKEMGM